jgi:hypothetical protein
VDLTPIKPRHVAFWLGTALSAASFAMYSVKDPVNDVQAYRGYEQVWITLLATVLLSAPAFLGVENLIVLASIFVLPMNPVLIASL